MGKQAILIGKRRIHTEYWLQKLRGRDHTCNLGTDVRITSKCRLQKCPTLTSASAVVIFTNFLYKSNLTYQKLKVNFVLLSHNLCQQNVITFAS